MGACDDAEGRRRLKDSRVAPQRSGSTAACRLYDGIPFTAVRRFGRPVGPRMDRPGLETPEPIWDFGDALEGTM